MLNHPIGYSAAVYVEYINGTVLIAYYNTLPIAWHHLSGLKYNASRAHIIGTVRVALSAFKAAVQTPIYRCPASGTYRHKLDIVCNTTCGVTSTHTVTMWVSPLFTNLTYLSSLLLSLFEFVYSPNQIHCLLSRLLLLQQLQCVLAHASHPNRAFFRP